MSLEDLLSADFRSLADRLNADGFADRLLVKLKASERLRLVAVGCAGAAGAAIAALQFGPLTQAIAEAAPMLAGMTVTKTTIAFANAPVMVTALLFAIVGGATAMIAPGSR